MAAKKRKKPTQLAELVAQWAEQQWPYRFLATPASDDRSTLIVNIALGSSAFHGAFITLGSIDEVSCDITSDNYIEVVGLANWRWEYTPKTTILAADPAFFDILKRYIKTIIDGSLANGVKFRPRRK